MKRMQEISAKDPMVSEAKRNPIMEQMRQGRIPMKLKILARMIPLVALFAVWSVIASAESADDPHHPAGESSSSQTSGTSPAPTAAPSGMGGQEMMGGGALMGNMMGRGASGMMGPSMCGPGMVGMGTIEHIDGWLAFLRTELKITDAQTKAWDQFADAMRTNAKTLGEIGNSMMPQMHSDKNQAPTPTLSDRLDAQERWLTARLKGVSAMKSTYAHLSETFSDDQKKAANELLAPHLGLMPMGMTRTHGG